MTIGIHHVTGITVNVQGMSTSKLELTRLCGRFTAWAGQVNP
jgi:hypothetical protein